jgi:hypothetical protein
MVLCRFVSCIFMSLRWRYAPACGSAVGSLAWFTPPLSLIALFFEKRNSGTDGATPVSRLRRFVHLQRLEITEDCGVLKRRT